jgi:hypothetical protein
MTRVRVSPVGFLWRERWWCGGQCHQKNWNDRTFSTNPVSGRITLRKQVSPLLKRIHPDFFSQHHDKIQQDNMHFLQSLNSLIDNVEQLQISCRKRNTCDITVPLLSSYKFTFHTKLPASTSDPDAIPDTKAIQLILNVPRDLTFRQTASSSVIRKRIATLLHRVGPVFEAVEIANPWELADPNEHEEQKAMPWERTSSRARSAPSSATHGFRKRRVGVSVDDPAIQAAIEEKMVEKSIAGNMTSIFGGADNVQLIKGDVDKYIRNGNVVTANLSPMDQLYTMKRLRDFFLKCGHLVNFSFSVWNSVLVLVDGTQTKNTFKKESLKKRTIVIVPPKFQSSLLVNYLHKSIPQARLVMPSIDGMKTDV